MKYMPTYIYMKSWRSIHHLSFQRGLPRWFSHKKALLNQSEAAANSERRPKYDTKHSENTSVQKSVKSLFNQIVTTETLNDLKAEIKRLKETAHLRQQDYKKDMSKRAEEKVRDINRTLSLTSKLVNELTGYTRIENLKASITASEQTIESLKKAISEAKNGHHQAVLQRSQSQKQINELLQRKAEWSLEDLEKFTKLYKNDHNLDREEQSSLEKLTQLEAQMEDAHGSLMTTILNRYHEEQVWSDKIRKFSTWGTLVIMCANLILFIAVQLIFEPWKRRRLVNSFESKVIVLFENQKERELEGLREDPLTNLDKASDTSEPAHSKEMTFTNYKDILLIPGLFSFMVEKIKRLYHNWRNHEHAPTPVYLDLGTSVSMNKLDLNLAFGFCLALGLFAGRLI